MIFIASAAITCIPDSSTLVRYSNQTSEPIRVRTDVVASDLALPADLWDSRERAFQTSCGPIAVNETFTCDVLDSSVRRASESDMTLLVTAFASNNRELTLFQVLVSPEVLKEQPLIVASSNN